MENTNTKIRENGFKVTPEWLEAVGIDLEVWHSALETLELEKAADKEADKVMENKNALFFDKQVKLVIRELQRRCESDNIVLYNCIFNYGYILGKRVERARRKKGTNED